MQESIGDRPSVLGRQFKREKKNAQEIEVLSLPKFQLDGYWQDV